MLVYKLLETQMHGSVIRKPFFILEMKVSGVNRS